MIQPVSQSELSKIFSWIDRLQSPQFNWTSDSLKAEFLSGLVVGFFISDQVVAFACVRSNDDHHELTVLATHPDYQGQGLMGQLLHNTLGQFDADKPIWLEVHESNQSARYLYEKLGFRQTGKRPKYYADGGSAILYTWGSGV